MDIKYNVSKLKNSKLEEIKDSVSVEEPLEMRLKYKKNNKWVVENISITMRTPGNDEDLIKGFLFNERIITNINDIESIEHKGEVSGAVIKVDGAYKAFKTKIKKGMKLVKPMDAKSLDALFYLHVYDLALIAYENKAMRKTLKIKKGLFG